MYNVLENLFIRICVFHIFYLKITISLNTAIRFLNPEFLNFGSRILAFWIRKIPKANPLALLDGGKGDGRPKNLCKKWDDLSRGVIYKSPNRRDFEASLIDFDQQITILFIFSGYLNRFRFCSDAAGEKSEKHNHIIFPEYFYFNLINAIPLHQKLLVARGLFTNSQ